MTRRAVILPAVLVTLTVGALIGTSALYFADAGRRAAAAGLDQAQVRALGWSGVQAAMAELAGQRDALIAGEAPQLTGEWIAFETSGGRMGLFRLLPIGPAGELAISEAGKLNLNHAAEEAIAKLPGLDEQLAAAIVAARPLDSLEDLLRIEGISWELVYGGQPGGEGAMSAAPETSTSQGVAGQPAGAFAGGGPPPLADTSTVYSFDPNIQCGVDDDARRGERRLNLNVEFNERLGRALDDRFGQGAGDAVRQIMESGKTFPSDASVVETLRFFQLPAEQWGPILDALTTTDHEFVPGRVDINTAPADVLAALPGLEGEIAAGIVARRESMSPDLRLSPTWPVTEDLLTPEQYQAIADLVTTRSAQWRVRIEAGLTAPGATGFSASVDDLAFDDFGVLESDGGTRLQRRVELEAVIDVASQRPRVAFLRDVTHQALARRLAAERAEEPGASREAEDREVEAEEDPRIEHLVDLELGMRPAREPAEAPEQAPPAPSDAQPAEPEVDAAAPGDEPEFVDRRRGRWTAGGAS